MVALMRQTSVVGGNQNGEMMPFDMMQEHIKNGGGGVTIQIAGWFIGNQNGGLMTQPARQCHSLLLASR